MPDPVTKLWMTTESGRTVYFDFRDQPEIKSGETIASVSNGPNVSPSGPTFGTPVITGTKVAVRFNGTLTAGVTYSLNVTVLTSNSNPITCSGTIKVEAP